jgi:hypothetical protein
VSTRTASRVILVSVLALIIVPFAVTLGFADWQSTFGIADAKGKENAKTLAAAKPQEFAAGKPSKQVTAKLLSAIASDDGSTALVFEITNASKDGALVWAPMSVDLLDASGKSIGNNTGTGTSPLLNHLPSIGPGETIVFVNDQLTATGKIADAKVVIGGEPEPAPAGVPEIVIKGLAIDASDPFGLAFTGTLVNKGKIEQPSIVVSVVARKGDAIAAAGTSVVSRLKPGQSQPFSGYWIGNPKGAKLEASAPASSTADQPGAADDPEIKKLLGLGT